MPPGLGMGLGRYLQDDSADLPHALDDGVWHPRDCDSPFSGVGQQVTSHLHLCPCALQEAERCLHSPTTPCQGSALHTSPVPLLSPPGPLQDLQCDASSPASPPSAPTGLCQPPHPRLCAPRGKRRSHIQATLRLTSRISRILAPALPMREPHWLAGMTRRRVTGALPADTPSPPAPRSCEGCGMQCQTPRIPQVWGHLAGI